MTPFEMLHSVDHTQLKAFASWEDIDKLCKEALEYQTASVCIPPSYIRRVREAYPDLTICTVVGFPLGYSVTAAKVVETKQALADGADEIDMVINIADAKNHLYDRITEEIRALKEAAGDHILKVIVETCYLTRDEKIALCKCVTEGGADYIKTSTGFGTNGATMEDVVLFREEIGPNVKIKAAGGVKSLKDLGAFLNAGCSRIGSSSCIQLVRDWNG